MLKIFFNIFNTILGQYFFIILCKNVLSYNEELFLFTIYILLFLIIINSMPLFIRNHIIRESFNLIEFYEKFFYLKILLLLKIIRYYNILSKKEIIKYFYYKIFFIIIKNSNLFNNLKKKKNIEIFFLLNYFLDKNNLIKKTI